MSSSKQLVYSFLPDVTVRVLISTIYDTSIIKPISIKFLNLNNIFVSNYKRRMLINFFFESLNLSIFFLFNLN